MNLVIMAGTVTDKPFRPGGGSRTVVKLRVENDAGRVEHVEFDTFAKAGDFAINLWTGDIISIRGHSEVRTYKEDGEQFTELRIVADYVELVLPASQQIRNFPPRPAVEAAMAAGAAEVAAAQAAAAKTPTSSPTTTPSKSRNGAAPSPRRPIGLGQLGSVGQDGDLLAVDRHETAVHLDRLHGTAIEKQLRRAVGQRRQERLMSGHEGDVAAAEGSGDNHGGRAGEEHLLRRHDFDLHGVGHDQPA